jgi:hypothetical protein
MLFLVSGCSHEPGSSPRDLEKQASLLKSGMTEREVKTFFSDYLPVTNVNEIGHIEAKNRDVRYEKEMTRAIEVTRLYIPSGYYSSWEEFKPKAFGSYLETCTVFFDTNQVIVGYYYQISGQW